MDGKAINQSWSEQSQSNKTTLVRATTKEGNGPKSAEKSVRLGRLSSPIICLRYHRLDLIPPLSNPEANTPLSLWQRLSLNDNLEAQLVCRKA